MSSPSYFTGSNPNIDTPTDRPQTLQVTYIASVDGSQWIWNGVVYILSPQQGTPKYCTATTSDVVSDGVTTMPVGELSISVPAGLTTVCAKYMLRCYTSNESFGSSILFPDVSGMTIDGLAYMSQTSTQVSTLNSIDNTDGLNLQFPFPVSTTSPMTMVVDLNIKNPDGQSNNWYFPINFVPSPSNNAYSRTLQTGSCVMYSLHY